ncbi:hypothetical protein WICMUC_001766 [Wickerhamomyces mucosus]|uniref:MSP domain-containing protein n=1 Tax=Wickerhamomyces mucosus TaxID=1378264 RepID=A0A9P8PT60_9ASCO|nr:hypothetical protein WICMUC_001766 [Wickerhamomyces mucosus]
MNISITPNLLEFRPPFTKPSTEIITITNHSNETAAFKVKTTAPKVYCVRPNAAIVEPNQSIDVSIILLGLKEEPTQDYKCNDKFLIVALPSPYDLGESTVAESWPKLEAEFKQQSVSKKIKVKYVLDEPITTIEQDTTSSSNNNNNNIVDSNQNNEPTLSSSVLETDKSIQSEKNNGSNRSISNNDDLTEEDRSKIEALNEKLDSNAAATSTSTEVAEQVNSSNSFTTFFLILIIAIIVAWLLF